MPEGLLFASYENPGRGYLVYVLLRVVDFALAGGQLMDGIDGSNFGYRNNVPVHLLVRQTHWD